MKKYILALAALAVTTFGAFAEPLACDIYSITPITDTSSLLVAGDIVAFRVRLLARNVDNLEVAPSAWQRVYLGIGSPELEDLQNPPKIGIVVSGHLRYADIIDAQEKAVTLIGWYERFRLARAFRPEVLAAFRVPKREFRLRQDDRGEWRVSPVAFGGRHRAAGLSRSRGLDGCEAAHPG